MVNATPAGMVEFEGKFYQPAERDALLAARAAKASADAAAALQPGEVYDYQGRLVAGWRPSDLVPAEYLADPEAYEPPTIGHELVTESQLAETLDLLASAPPIVPLYPSFDRIAAPLQLGIGSCTVAIASDSTANDTVDWVRLWLEIEKQRRGPGLRIEFARWNTTTNAYDETVVQEGTNLTPPAGNVLVDNFNRTGEIVGSTTSGGQAWAGNTGGFTGTGTVVTNSAAKNLAFDAGVVDGSLEFDLVVRTAPTPAATQTYRLYIGATSTSFNSGVWAGLSVNTSGGCTVGVYKTIAGTTTALLAPVGTGLTSASGTPQTLKVKLTQTIQNVSLQLTPNGGATTTHTPTAILEADYTTLGTFRGISAASGAITVMDLDNAVMAVPAGAPQYLTLRVLNAAVGGADMSYQQSRIATMYPDADQIDVMIMSTGHNYGLQTAAQFTTSIDAFVTAYAATHPESAYILSSQNPQYSPALYVSNHALRQVAGRAHARSKGWGYLPAFERFKALSDPALVGPDGIHPTTPATITVDTTKGSGVWATLMAELVAAHEVK